MNAPVTHAQFTPSVQQAAFIDWCRTGTGSCVLEAVAGSGKTTVLLNAVRVLRGCTAIMAYNKKIAEELKRRLIDMGIDWKQCNAGTVHSFGMSAYRKAFPGVKVEGSKVSNIADTMWPEFSPMAKIAKALCKLVSLAKQVGLGVLSDAGDLQNWMDIVDHHDIEFGAVEPEEACAAAYKLLSASNAQVGIIDFDDMCYLPLLLKLRFWKFDNIMLDEAQDTNPIRRALAREMLKPGGRLMAVGDRHQGIYGFTGADNDALDLIRSSFNCIDMPMTKTYRCPKAVVQFASQWVSHIEAVDTAPEGEVVSMELDTFMADPAKIEGLQQAAILCRNTKPLVSMALQLIRRKIACKIEGKEIAEQLKKLVRRWKVTTTSALSDKLEIYREREIVKFTAKKKEHHVEIIHDTVDTLQTIIDECNAAGLKTVQAVTDYLDELFADNVDQMLVLSTIHKSKGREWNDVYWLDRQGTCPSRYAKQAWQLDQEVNLQYVAATRAKARLIDLFIEA